MFIPNFNESYHGCFVLGDAPNDPNLRFHPHGWNPVLGNKRKEGKKNERNTSENSKSGISKQGKGQRKVSNQARSVFVGVATNEARFTRGDDFKKPPKAKAPRQNQRQARTARRQQKARSASPTARHDKKKEMSIDELTLMLRGFDAHLSFTENAGEVVQESTAELIGKLDFAIQKLQIQRKYQQKFFDLHLQRAPQQLRDGYEHCHAEAIFCNVPFDQVVAYPPTNLYESLGYATNSLDTYRAKLLKIKWKLQEAERERKQLEEHYKHFAHDYLRFNSELLVSDRFENQVPVQPTASYRPSRNRYAYANMATVTNLPDEPEQDTPRAGTAGTNQDPGDSVFDDFPSLIGDPDNAVPFVSTDGASASTITAVHPDLPTPARNLNSSFGPMNISTEKSEEIRLMLLQREREALQAALQASGGGSPIECPIKFKNGRRRWFYLPRRIRRILSRRSFPTRFCIVFNYI